MHKYILDLNDQPVRCDDVMTWGRWFERNDDKRRFGYTDINAQVYVSTVFLGMDHSFTGGGDPVLWETMIFGSEHDGYQERYTSREAAEQGHLVAVALARVSEGKAH